MTFEEMRYLKTPVDLIEGPPSDFEITEKLDWCAHNQIETGIQLLDLIEQVLKERITNPYRNLPLIEASQKIKIGLQENIRRHRGELLHNSERIILECISLLQTFEEKNELRKISDCLEDDIDCLVRNHIHNIVSIENQLKIPKKPMIIHSDPPGFGSITTELLIRNLIYINEASLQNCEKRLIEYIILELEIQIAPGKIFPDVIFFKKIKKLLDEFIGMNPKNLNPDQVDSFKECVTLLDFISKDPNNLFSDPPGYEYDVEQWNQVIGRSPPSRVREVLNNLIGKCPSCNEKFDKCGSEVTRTVDVIKCPKCNQSIAW